MKNKMTPKQALEDMKSILEKSISSYGELTDLDLKDFDTDMAIIETELETTKIHQKVCDSLINQNKELSNQLTKLEKFNEIINKKNVDICGIKESKNYYEYNAQFPTTLNEFLTEEEYNVLREVLMQWMD